MDASGSIPSVVPSSGVMLLARKKEQDILKVLAATENSSELLGYYPEQLFALTNLTEILDKRGALDLLDSVDFIQHDEDILCGGGEPIIFPVSFLGPSCSEQQFWCSIHASPGGGGLLILELKKQSQIEKFDPRMNRRRRLLQKFVTPNQSGIEPERHSFSKSHLSGLTGDERAMQILSVLSHFEEHLSWPDAFESLMKNAVWLSLK